MIKYFFVSLFYLALCACSMNPKQWLNGCYMKGFKFENNDIVFNLPEQPEGVYILRNNAKFTVSVDRDYQEGRPGASAGWMSHIDAGNASALILGKQNVRFKCLRERNNQWLTINCQEVLQVCQKPLKNIETGSYWLIENKPQSEIWKKIDHKAFAK